MMSRMRSGVRIMRTTSLRGLCNKNTEFTEWKQREPYLEPDYRSFHNPMGVHEVMEHFQHESPIVGDLNYLKYGDGQQQHWEDEGEKWNFYMHVILPILPIVIAIVVVSDLLVPHKHPEDKPYRHNIKEI